MLERSALCGSCFSGDETSTPFFVSSDALFRNASTFSGVIGEEEFLSEFVFGSSGSVMAKETFANMDSASPVFFLSSLFVLVTVSSSSWTVLLDVLSP